MATALQQLPHSELVALVEAQRLSHTDLISLVESERAARIKHEKQIKQYQAGVFSLEFQVKELQRLIFGSTRERFISDVHASQLPLGLGVDTEQVAAAVEASREEITY